MYLFFYTILGRLWDRVDLKGLSITSLIVLLKLFSYNSRLAIEDTAYSGEQENKNNGSHEVMRSKSELKPSISFEFIE